MTDAKHTPGPWVVPDQTWSRTLTVNTGGGMDAIMIPCAGSGGAMSYTDEVCTLSWKDDGEWLANARLIAAAPDLLDGIEGMLDRYISLVDSGDAGFWDPEVEPQVIAARAAIAKARGQA